MLNAGKLMFHSTTLLPSLNSVLLCGGRTSPKQGNSSIFMLNYEERRVLWTCTVPSLSSDVPEGRWRHTATPITCDGEVIIPLFIHAVMCRWIKALIKVMV